MKLEGVVVVVISAVVVGFAICGNLWHCKLFMSIRIWTNHTNATAVRQSGRQAAIQQQQQQQPQLGATTTSEQLQSVHVANHYKPLTADS